MNERTNERIMVDIDMEAYNSEEKGKEKKY